MLLPSTAFAAAAIDVNGGAITTSAFPRRPASNARNSATYATVSAVVLNILKLPAMSGDRVTVSSLQSAVKSRSPQSAVQSTVHHFRSGNAATPGSSAPPRNSSDAPPPVEMCVILSVRPAALIAATESPPPMIVVPSTDATALATASVPFANGATSNTPIGPFHTTVLASLNRPE